MVGVPKTIDNDILLMDKTFGFDTAVEEAQRAINSAYIEVACFLLLNQYCRVHVQLSFLILEVVIIMFKNRCRHIVLIMELGL